NVQMKATTSGTWIIRGPYEVKYKLNVTVAHPPTITNAGPYVIKRDIIKTMMVEPKDSIKMVTIPLHVSTIKLNPACQSYMLPLLIGWNRWLHVMEPEFTPKRPKRDLIAKLMGGAGASLGAINTIDQIHMAQWLVTLSNNFAELIHPVQDALLALDKLQLDITKILPLWIAAQKEDNLILLHAMEYIQNNVSLVLACIQAQSLLIDLAKDIIRDSAAGKVPIEFVKLLRPQLSAFEQENPEWWSVVNTNYDLKEKQLQLSILMLRDALKEQIYPIIPLGLFVNHSLLLPLQDQMWAHFKGRIIKTVNLQACVEQGNVIIPQTIIFVSRECHYDLHPSDSTNNHLVVVQIAEGCVCVCIQSLCPVFTVNTYYWVNNSVVNNLCLCKIFHIQGCDVERTLFKASQEQLHTDLQIIKEIEPIQIGPNLNAMASLFHHPELIDLIEEVTNVGNKTGIIVQYAIDEIYKISKNVKTSIVSHHW
uniref:Uncharacterized protein n=1 Tax=Pelodiscus sinensis TaxID=13735 RepID=K7F5S5_PELSI